MLFSSIIYKGSTTTGFIKNHYKNDYLYTIKILFLKNSIIFSLLDHERV